MLSANDPMFSSNDLRLSRLQIAIVVACLTLAAAWLRFHDLSYQPFWNDEVYTAVLIDQPFEDVLRASLEDSKTPLYFLAGHFVASARRDQEYPLRAISAASGTLLVPAVFLLTVVSGTNLATALVTCILVVLSPLQLWYSQEARPYELAALLFICALAAMRLALDKRSRSWWVAYAALSILAFLAYTAMISIVLISWGWVLLKHRDSTSIRSVLLVTLLIALIVGPMLLVLENISNHGHAPWRSSALEAPYALFTYIAGYSFGPSQREIQNSGPVAAVRASLPEVAPIVAMLALFAYCVISGYKREDGFPLILFLIPLSFGLIAARLAGHPFNVRYTLPAQIGFLWLATTSISRRRSRLWMALPVGLIVIFSVADYSWFTQSRYWKEDSRAAIAWLENHVPDGGSVTVAPGYMIAPLKYYLARLPNGHQLNFVEFDGPGSLKSGALAVTREHHVSEPREIERDFIDLSDSPVQQATVVGFRLFARGQR